MTDALLRRVVRRETHSPRTVATVVVLVILALAAIYVGVEIVRHLLAAGPQLAAPGAALAWLEGLPENNLSAPVIAGGVIVAIAGIVLVWLSLAPGRRPKHELAESSHAVIVDNGVVASSIAERVRRELELVPGAVVVGISHRGADVTVRPEPGRPVEKSWVQSVAEDEVASYDLSPRVTVHARVLRPTEREGAS